MSVSRTFPLVLAALVASSAYGQAVKWAPYTSKADGFSVLLPGKPTTSDLNNSAQGVSAVTRNFIARSGSLLCVVTKSKLSSNVTAAIRKTVADGIKTGLLNSVRGTASSDRTVAYGSRSGRQIDFKNASGQPGTMWITEAPHNTLYTLTIFSQTTLTQADRLKFFGSLKI